MNSNNFLDKLYGIEQNPSKIPMVMGTILLITAFLGVGVIANIQLDIISDIFRWYIIIIFFVLAFFFFAAYFFQNAKGKNQYKKVKYTLFLLSLLLLAIVFLPVTILAFFSHKIKFEYLFPYSTVYIVSIFIPMLISLIIWSVVYAISSTVLLLNASAIAALIAFLSWRYGSLLALILFHKIGKKLNDEVYLSITKDLYVVVFVMITAVTIVTNCINFPEPYSSMVRGFTSAFAIYIAWDRLLGKWDKTNKDYEKNKIHIGTNSNY